MLFPYDFYKNTAALSTLLLYVVTIPSAFAVIVAIAFSPLYDFCLVILIPAGLTPNNKIDSFLRLAFSRRLFRMCFSLSLSPSPSISLSLAVYSPQMAVTVPLYGSAISRDILYLLYTTSATSSRPSPPPFLSRLLTAVCQPSTPPYFSRVLARSSGGRRW